MREQGGSFALSSVSIGGKRFGAGTALVDEDVLRVLLLDSADGEKALQLRYDAILGVALSDGTVVITARDGRALAASTGEASAFRASLLAACRALPEVTRALRALGSRRGSRTGRRPAGDDEARFFAPLIAARRASMDARDAAAVISSFDARQLARSLAATIVSFAGARSAGHPARHRALEAELSDATEQLSATLDDLLELARQASGDVDDLTRWRNWAEGVQRTFEAADRAWMSIDPVLVRP